MIRTRHRFSQQSFVGFLYTRRATMVGDTPGAPPPAANQHTIGTDITIATPRFFGSKNFETGVSFAHTTGLADRPGGTDTWSGRVQYNNEPVRAEFFYNEYQPAYDAAVGFTPRRNFRRWNPQFEYEPRVNWKVIREFAFAADGEVSTLIDGTLVGEQLFLTPLDILLQAGDRIQFQLFPTVEQLEVDFAIAPGLVLPQGQRYQWLRRQVVYQGANQRKVALRLGARTATSTTARAGNSTPRSTCGRGAGSTSSWPASTTTSTWPRARSSPGCTASMRGRSSARGSR